jgi:hypothetical protein
VATSLGLYSVPKAGGTPRRLSLPVSASSVVVADGFAYYTVTAQWLAASDKQVGPGAGQLERVALDGQSPPEVLASGENGPNGLVLAGDRLVWADRGGTIFSMPRQGGPVAEWGTGPERISQIVWDGKETLFLLTHKLTSSTPFGKALPGGIRTMPVGGGKAVDFVSTEDPRGMLIADGHLYWSDTRENVIRRAPLP